MNARAQTFDPRRQTMAGGAAPISTFRARQYDPATGKWLQEDPIGLAGGTNLYEYNGNDPNSFSDPMGLDCHDEKGPRPCHVGLSATGRHEHTSLQALAPGVFDKLQKVADAADVDLGVNYTTNGKHYARAHQEGRAVDIGEIDGHRINCNGNTCPGMTERAAHVQSVANSLGGLQPVGGNLGPAGKYEHGRGPLPIAQQKYRSEHLTHVHLAWEP